MLDTDYDGSQPRRPRHTVTSDTLRMPPYHYQPYDTLDEILQQPFYNTQNLASAATEFPVSHYPHAQQSRPFHRTSSPGYLSLSASYSYSGDPARPNWPAQGAQTSMTPASHIRYNHLSQAASDTQAQQYSNFDPVLSQTQYKPPLSVNSSNTPRHNASANPYTAVDRSSHTPFRPANSFRGHLQSLGISPEADFTNDTPADDYETQIRDQSRIESSSNDSLGTTHLHATHLRTVIKAGVSKTGKSQGDSTESVTRRKASRKNPKNPKNVRGKKPQARSSTMVRTQSDGTVYTDRSTGKEKSILQALNYVSKEKCREDGSQRATWRKDMRLIYPDQIKSYRENPSLPVPPEIWQAAETQVQLYKNGVSMKSYWKTDSYQGTELRKETGRAFRAIAKERQLCDPEASMPEVQQKLVSLLDTKPDGEKATIGDEIRARIMEKKYESSLIAKRAAKIRAERARESMLESESSRQHQNSSNPSPLL